jgi:Double-GTPase 2
MQYLFLLLLIIVALILVFLIAWIALALLLRAFSMLILYWVIGFSVMFAAGLIFGLAIPWRVLRNRGEFAIRQLTPDDVVAGKAFKGRLRGESKHYGWDRAWPMYIPFQARQDARGVVGEARTLLVKIWVRITNRIRSTPQSVGVVVGVSLPIPFFGFWAGVWLSIGAWLLAMLAIGFVVWIFQRIMLLGLRWADIIYRRRKNASLKCYYCYNESRTPSYRCLNPQCTIIHRSMLPGFLGLTTRRCACGTQLPNTIRAAARRLSTLCPYCDRELADESGIRHTVQLPVIGSVAAGKTRLLMAAIVQLESWLTERQGMINAVTDEAQTYLGVARRTVHSHADTVKTPDALPEGVPLILGDAAGEVTELQLMDAAGEAFATWDTTADLRYLDNAAALIFVLDPLAWPQLRQELERGGLAHTVVVTGEDQKVSYGAAIDRMRAESVPLRRRKLGVVVSKADVLLKLPSAAELTNCTINNNSIRKWMWEHDFDLLITGMEMDFGEVRYFLVDSMNSQDPDQPLSPWWTLQWALQANGSTLTFIDTEPKAGPATPVPASA